MELSEVKELLLREDYTCVLAKDSILFTSRARGVRPLLDCIESGTDTCGALAADKIVGKAAALLYAHMGIGALHAVVVSEAAVAVCAAYGIALTYDTVTPQIINRAGDDICPMEKAVQGIDTPAAALVAVRAKLKTLQAAAMKSRP